VTKRPVGTPPLRSPPLSGGEAPIGQWLLQAMRQTHGSDAAVQALKVPFVIVPLVNADSNQHSYDGHEWSLDLLRQLPVQTTDC
jgi:hypothetical protein